MKQNASKCMHPITPSSPPHKHSIPRIVYGPSATRLRPPLPHARLGEGLERALSAGRREGDLVLGFLAALHLGFVHGFAVDVFAFGGGGGGGVDVHGWKRRRLAGSEVEGLWGAWRWVWRVG